MNQAVNRAVNRAVNPMENEMLRERAHRWLADDTVPDPVRNAPPELTERVETVLGIVAWVGTAAGVAGVLITGAMMSISLRRGEGSEHLGRLGMVLAGCVLVTSAGPLVSFVV